MTYIYRDTTDIFIFPVKHTTLFKRPSDIHNVQKTLNQGLKDVLYYRVAEVKETPIFTLNLIDNFQFIIYSFFSYVFQFNLILFLKKKRFTRVRDARISSDAVYVKTSNTCVPHTGSVPSTRTSVPVAKHAG